SSLSATGATLSRPTTVAFDGRPHLMLSAADGALICLDTERGEVRWRRSGDQTPGHRAASPPALIRVDDCLLTVGDELKLRTLDRGELLHTCEQPIESPACLGTAAELMLILGEASDSEEIDDRLLGVDLNHFLAEVD
ncbi:MAG: hypothetical protein ABEL76_13605, partial [Bradymonadaceae bacterium]